MFKQNKWLSITPDKTTTLGFINCWIEYLCTVDVVIKQIVYKLL